MLKSLKLQSTKVGADVIAMNIYHTIVTGSNLLQANVTPAQLANGITLYNVPDNVSTIVIQASSGSCSGSLGSTSAYTYTAPSCSAPTLTNLTNSSDALTMSFTKASDCNYLEEQHSTDQTNWTSSIIGCTSPQTFNSYGYYGTWYYRLKQYCPTGFESTFSNTLSYNFGTAPPQYNTGTYVYSGIYTYPDPVHPNGGTIYYTDANGNPQTITNVYDTDMPTFVAVIGSVSAVGCYPIDQP